MSDNAPTEAEERAFSDAMDADRMPSATVEYWVYAAALHERDAALALAERRAGEIADLEAAVRDLWRKVPDYKARDLEAATIGLVNKATSPFAAAPPPATTNEDALQRLITAATRLCAVSWDNDGRLWEMRCELRDVLESLPPPSPPPPASEGDGEGAKNGNR